MSSVNIANALTLGLPQDLHVDTASNEANIALLIFFVPYINFEIPSNFLMRYFKPHVGCKSRFSVSGRKRRFWPVAVSACILSFGVVMLCQGLGKFNHLKGLLVLMIPSDGL